MEGPTGNTFKVVFVGDGGVGKTAFIKKLTVGIFEPKYLATIGAESRNHTFQTNYGEFRLQILDCAGQEKFGTRRCDNYAGADAALVMFDTTSRCSYKNSVNWARDVANVCPEIPFVVCGNKVDIGDRKVKDNEITLHRKLGTNYYHVSAKTNYNLQEPFLFLLRKLTGKKDLAFAEYIQ